MSDVNDFLLSTGVPAAKFPTVGTTLRGTVLDARVEQQRDFATGEPKTFEDGNPVQQLVVTLSTDERDAEIDGDDGTRRLYCRGQMLAALRTALRKANARLEAGGTLVVRYVGDGEPSKRGYNPPKLYEAAYKPGVGVDVDGLLETSPAPADLL